MPRLRPPPLHLMPAFEAAARLLSFAKAAEELHVTGSAISQQIRQLEDWLGVPLFHRKVRQVALTEAGHTFAAVVRDTLTRYRKGHADFLHRHVQPTLRLSAPPVLAHELLIPALAGFQQAHPGVTLELEMGLELSDLLSGQADAAVRVGGGDWPGLTAWPLMPCAVTVGGAPGLLARHPVAGPEDFAAHTLIHYRRGVDDWQAVADGLGLTSLLPHRGVLRLDSELAALRAAEQGLGLMICLLPACQAWFDSGRLAHVMPPRPYDKGYHFVFNPTSPKQELMEATHAWVKQAMSAWDPPASPAARPRRRSS